MRARDSSGRRVAPRRVLAIAVATSLATAAGCGDSTTQPSGASSAGVRAVAGSGASDTVLAAARTLVVEIRGAGGALATGTPVQFTVRPAADSTRRFETPLFVCAKATPFCGPSTVGYGISTTAALDTTDASGRATAVVRAGTVAGPTYVIVAVPDLGLRDSVPVTVQPGAARGVKFAVPAVVAAIGGRAVFRAAVVDAYGNARAEAPTYAVTAPPAVATLDAASATVTGVDVGSGYVTARYATAVDSVPLRVVPAGRLIAWQADNGALVLINTDGTSPRALGAVDETYINGLQPRLAPDRRTAITLKYPGAVVFDTAGAAPRTIAPPAGVTGFAVARIMDDGSVLAVGQQGAPYGVPVGSPLPTALYRIGGDGSAAKVLDLPNALALPNMVDVAPDGSRVAYVTSGAPGLVVVTVATGAVTTVDRNGVSPRFSAAGDRLAYLVALDITGGGPLAVANVDGTGRATFGATAYAPGGLAWSPDGAYVLGHTAAGVRALRLRDGADVVLLFPYVPLAGAAGFVPSSGLGNYALPEWR